MKQSIYLLTLALLFVFGCKSPNEADPSRVNDPNNPSSSNDGGTSDACFDIPTPSMTSATQADEEISTDHYAVTVCWMYTVPSSCTYYTATKWYPQGNKKPARWYGLCPTSTLNPAAENSPYEFWGGSQKSIVTINSGGQSAYSGHYDVLRSTNGGVTWTEIAETRDLCYTDDNNGAGWAVGTELMYSVKEKSLEGSSPNQCTHHSKNATGIGITIEDPCYETEISDSYSLMCGVFGDNVVWGQDENGDCDGSFTISNNGNINPHWAFLINNRTVNSCTGDTTVTPTGDTLMVPLCVRLGGGPNDIDPATAPDYPAHWQAHKYHLDGVMDQPEDGNGDYILYYLKDEDDDENCTYPDDVIGWTIVHIDH